VRSAGTTSASVSGFGSSRPPPKRPRSGSSKRTGESAAHEDRRGLLGHGVDGVLKDLPVPGAPLQVSPLMRMSHF
jgi:hypothetical protein